LFLTEYLLPKYAFFYSSWALLEELGETLPPDASRPLIQEEMLSTKNALSTIRDMDITKIPRLKDWNIRARQSALSSLIFLYLTDAKYMKIPQVACRIVNLSIQHGEISSCYAHLSLVILANILNVFLAQAFPMMVSLGLVSYTIFLMRLIFLGSHLTK
jgi:hypothetical protein